MTLRTQNSSCNAQIIVSRIEIHHFIMNSCYVSSIPNKFSNLCYLPYFSLRANQLSSEPYLKQRYPPIHKGTMFRGDWPADGWFRSRLTGPPPIGRSLRGFLNFRLMVTDTVPLHSASASLRLRSAPPCPPPSVESSENHSGHGQSAPEPANRLRNQTSAGQSPRNLIIRSVKIWSHKTVRVCNDNPSLAFS